jgi:proline iminopeptidase
VHGEIIADDGCRLWSAQAGSGPPLVFCHGGPGLWDYFDEVAPAFGDVARTVRWDQRGCGRSERRGPYTVDRFVADLDAVRRHLGVERVDLFGHSWGATLALRYAMARPDRVRGLVYVAGTGVDADDTWKPAFYRNLAERVDDRAPAADEREQAIVQWTADFVDQSTARAHAARMADPWFGIAHECANAIKSEVGRYLRDQDVAALCRTLTVPALIVDGEHDIRPRSAVDSLARALPGARRVTLAGAGHNPWVERPEDFRETVAGFLREL